MRNPAFALRQEFPRPLPINTGQYRVSTPSTGPFDPKPDSLVVFMQGGRALLMLVLAKNDKTTCLVRNVLEDARGAISLGDPYTTLSGMFFEYIGPIRVAKHVSYQLVK